MVAQSTSQTSACTMCEQKSYSQSTKHLRSTKIDSKHPNRQTTDKLGNIPSLEEGVLKAHREVGHGHIYEERTTGLCPDRTQSTSSVSSKRASNDGRDTEEDVSACGSPQCAQRCSSGHVIKSGASAQLPASTDNSSDSSTSDKTEQVDCSESAITKEISSNYLSRCPLSLSNRELGRWGEYLAARFMEHIDYKILVKNWRCDYGEVDLVMRNPEGCLIFAEVKTRRDEHCGAPEQSVTSQKVNRYKQIAKCFMKDALEPYSIDILSVQVIDSDKVRIDHFKDISAFLAE